jgi:dTDP-4-dehydro-6-deoxy-alpha-D-glucopyranose 2,3-dehydratase
MKYIDGSFLNSAISFNNPFNDIALIHNWIKEQNKKINVNIDRITFDEMLNWQFRDNCNTLEHTTGNFFSIVGINIETNYGEIYNWEQPIINQPEIGYLGFIVKEFNGVLHFLIQAKIEPGNVNYVQLSPTLQATKSNYNQAHKGKKPAYLEYFVNASPNQILLDQLQSEQGGRFLKKRNRNIIIKVDSDIELYDNFIWMTLAQIKEMMRYDNIVNMDTRTVISGIPFEEDYIKEDIGNIFLQSLKIDGKDLHHFDHLLHYITRRKVAYSLEVNKVPLANLRNWVIEDSQIKHIENKFFKVIATRVSIDNREVSSWCQPMIQPAQEGICAFICKEINGKIHFIVQIKLEAGNFDILELAPTVQCLTGNYRSSGINSLPFLDYVLNVSSDKVVYDTLQSEEGGRFYKEQNKNLLILANKDEFTDDLPENYIWMSFSQLIMFLKFNNYLNIQSRSLLAAINFI